MRKPQSRLPREMAQYEESIRVHLNSHAEVNHPGTAEAPYRFALHKLLSIMVWDSYASKDSAELAASKVVAALEKIRK